MNIRRWTASLVAIGTLISVNDASALPNPKQVFCFSPAYAAWRSFPAPTIDGVIDFPTDKGWEPAFKYVFGNGTSDPDVTLHGYFDNSSVLDMGFTVRNDKTYDDTDTILVLFETADPHGFGELVINPLQQDVANQSGAPPTGRVKYFTSTDPNTQLPGQWAAAGSDPAWLEVKRTTTPDASNKCTAGAPGSHCRWDVEVKLDGRVAGAPSLSTIRKIFVDVLRADRTPILPLPKTVQFVWPPGAPAAVEGDLDSGTPSTSNWGSAAVSSSSCYGVWFRGMGNSISDIGIDTGTTSNGLPSFKLNQQVTLSAHIHNSTEGLTAPPPGVTAQGVAATFFHAPFGMTGFNNFILIPSGGGTTNPTAATDIAYDGSTNPATTQPGTPLSVKWTPTTQCVNATSTPNCDTGHQCILVRLNSTVNDTTFINQSEFQNMWGNVNSHFEGTARISVEGLPAPEGGGPQRVRLATTRAAQYAFGDGGIEGVPCGTLTAQLNWFFHGSRFTGKYITIEKIKHEIWEPVASYGYVLQHPLAAEFQTAFEGRHASTMTSFRKDGSGTLCDPAAIREINLALANEPERPSVNGWELKVGDLKPLPNSGDDIYELQIPVGGALALPTASNYVGGDGGSSKPPGNCCASRTSPATTAAGMLIVGLIAYRRRRENV